MMRVADFYDCRFRVVLTGKPFLKLDCRCNVDRTFAMAV